MARRSKMKGMKTRNAIYGYLFILPFVIGFLFFMVKPLAQSLYMSLSEVTVSSAGYGYEYIGLENYIFTFTVDAEFNQMVVDEFGSMIYNALATMVFAFFIALLLNQNFKGRTFVRAIFFLPVILSSGVLVGLEYNNTLLSSMKDIAMESNGDTSVTTVIENILENSGISHKILNVIFEIVNSVYKVAIASGIQIIIFLSGLQTIPKSMYEAASIEGCSSWESLWKITFPMVSPMILVCWIYTIIDFFMNSDSAIMNKIDTNVTLLKYGFSSAMSWIYFLIVLAIIGISSWLISKVVYYYE